MFTDRYDAGKRLAQRLKPYKGRNTIVLGLARGGVPVAFEIAKALEVPLDTFVVRKVGAPSQPELAIGAIAEGGEQVLDQEMIVRLSLSNQHLVELEEKEREELERRVLVYRNGRVLNLERKTVILVDDGFATGLTAMSAVKSILTRNPKKLIVAVPVCSLEAADSVESLLRPADELVCLRIPPNFNAVGEWYSDFRGISDQEVVNVLKRASSERR